MANVMNNILEHMEHLVSNLLSKLNSSNTKYSSIRGLWAGCALVPWYRRRRGFPVTRRKNSYVTETLQAYKNRETKGPMSSTMCAAG